MLLRLLKSKILFLLEITVFILVLIAFFSIRAKRSAIEQEIYYITNKITALKEENGGLKRRLEKADDKDYMEFEARRKLNYKKPGETVFVFYEDTSPSVGDSGLGAQDASESEYSGMPNPVAWFKYFFSP